MAGRIVRRDRAKLDLIEQATYIAEDNPDAAERFLVAAERAFDRLVAMPMLGRPQPMHHRQLRTLRMWPVPQFENHLIFYQPLEDGVEIVRVLHGSRDVRAILHEREQPHSDTR